jgi:nitrate reductase alpha subunit
VKKLIVTDNKLNAVTVDPGWETADVNVHNNHYPRKIIPSRIDAYKAKKSKDLVRRDIMHDVKTELKDPKIKPYQK